MEIASPCPLVASFCLRSTILRTLLLPQFLGWAWSISAALLSAGSRYYRWGWETCRNVLSVFQCFIFFTNRDSVSLLQAWLNKRTAQEASVFQTLYDKIFEDIHVFMKLNLNPKMNLLECNYIVQVRFFFLYTCYFELRFFPPLSCSLETSEIENSCSP